MAEKRFTRNFIIRRHSDKANNPLIRGIIRIARRSNELVVYIQLESVSLGNHCNIIRLVGSYMDFWLQITD